MSSHFVRCAAVGAVLIGTITSGNAGGGAFTRGCAARDMQIMMMLEHREGTNAITAQEHREIFDARLVCSEGRVIDALTIYDGIARRIQ
jgi:hypothetical protein